MNNMSILYKLRLQFFIFRNLWMKGTSFVSILYVLVLLCGVFSTLGDESLFNIVAIVITSFMALMGGSAFRSSLFVDGQAFLAGLIMVIILYGGALIWINNVDARIHFFSYSLDAWIWISASFAFAFVSTTKKFKRSNVFYS